MNKLKSILPLVLLSLFVACMQQEMTPKQSGQESDSLIEATSCVCAEIYAPVCGSDGKTYSNACEAACKSVEFTEGECQEIE